MYKLPIKCPRKPRITQVYGETANNAWYQANGINIPYHNGVDVVTGNAIETHGTTLVCPFPTAKVVKVTFTSPMSTKGNGVTIESKIDGNRIQLVFWHTNEVTVKLNTKLKEGETVCYIGNSGLCNPAPTADEPYHGSHLHFMLYINGVLVDPLLYFGKEAWYNGEDSGIAHDIEPFNWAMAKKGITDMWEKLVYALKWTK